MPKGPPGARGSYYHQRWASVRASRSPPPPTAGPIYGENRERKKNKINNNISTNATRAYQRDPPGHEAHITTRGGHQCGHRGPPTAGQMPALVMEKVD